ncbi:MAG: Na+/H+ antiporter NhaA [Rhizobiales bacterium NRL2]|jgi:NhaA family Na+:H+ antiporter|nr:MAG: Na+/H+ antiporter NhaA [Rhizobiales bacterium NRL2]
MTGQDSTNLPPAITDRITRYFARLLKIKAATGGMLFATTFMALILSNSAWSEPFLAFWETPIGLHAGSVDFTRSLRLWINDGLMTLFFFLVSLELKRALVLGELRSLRVAALPLFGALGGMLVPAALYLALMHGQSGSNGWGTVVASDTAFVIGCLALLGGRVPPSLRLFLLSLAIFDDVGAILIVAVVGHEYSLNWTALALAVLGLAAVLGARGLGIRSAPIYFVLGGMIWFCFDASGIHPTIAGVILGLMTSTHGWVSDHRLRSILGRVLSYPTGDHWSGDTTDRDDLRRVRIAATETLSPEERLEMALRPWVGFVVMPLFALANAGVVISGVDFAQPVSVAIMAGLVIGKPGGVLIFSWVAVRLGLAIRTAGLSWPVLIAGALLTGIGFTMSLLIASLVYDPIMLNAAKLGIYTGSVFSAAAGLLMLLWLTSSKRTVRDTAR